MASIYTIYVDTSSGIYESAKGIALAHGFSTVPFLGEKWMVIHIRGNLIKYTNRPPNTKDSTVLVATSIPSINSNLPATQTEEKLPPESLQDSFYENRIVFVYDTAS